MQLQSENLSNSVRKGDIVDPVSQKIYSLEQGALCVRSQKDSSTQKYYLPQLFETQAKQRYSLRFKKLNNSSLVFNPSGRSLTCKSDKIQEVDMNLTYSTGVALWSITCSSNCLSLIIGVKNVQKKKQHCLQFTIQNTTKISLKLDICDRKLKAWIYKPLNISEKKINLSQQISQWTPFIRVKGAGVSLFLSDLVEDPEGKISKYNIFGIRNTSVQPNLELTKNIENKLSQNYTLKLIDTNTLLLYSKQQIRLVRRLNKEKQFNFNFGQLSNDGKFYVKFNKNQVQVLRKLGFTITGQEGDSCGKTFEEWTNWMVSAFTLLDTQYRNIDFSKQICYRAYEILLQKIQTFKNSIKLQTKPCAALQSDINSTWGLQQSLLPLPSTNFSVPATIKLNNQTPLKIQKQIKDILWTQHFLIVLLAQSQRIIIINREDTLFKVGEISLKRGFKKEYQLNQYQKQLDSLQSSNSNEPSIYKILKNCLRYADKIKLPEKQIKAEQSSKKQKQKNIIKEKEKEQKKVKKGDSPDQSMVNTLVGMGFSQSQAISALTQAKNSLEKAIQIILTQPPKQVKTSIKTSSKNKTWECTQCTLVNQQISLTCIVCEFPKPPQVVQTKKQEIQSKEQKVQQKKVIEQDVESKNIQAGLISLYAWQLEFAYCPLVLAGVFQGKLRLRLFGPNPKYYSLFYNRDQQFVDLTNLTIHNQAYAIDQRPIRYQFYLNSTTTQQKQSAYGWISIEDSDIDIKGKILNIIFNKSTIVNDKIIFFVNIQAELNGEKYNRIIKISICIDKIYAQKNRAIYTQGSEKKIEQQQFLVKIPQTEEKTKINCLEIPENGYLQIFMSRNNGKGQQIRTNQQNTTVLDKITQVKSYLPVIASHEQGSSQITTLISALQPGQKPLILKHLHNKSMSIEYIVLEKIGKNLTNSNYKGYIYLSEDPKKKPIRKIRFELQKGKKKFYIQIKQLQPSSYVTIELTQSQLKGDSVVIQQLALVGIIGKQFQRNRRNNSFSFINLSKNVNIQIDQGTDSKYKLQTQLLNSEYDLLSIPASQANQTVQQLIRSGCQMDLSIKIFNLQAKTLNLKLLKLQGWQIIRTKAHWLNSNRKYILQQNYKQLLQKFLQTFDINYLDDLSSDQQKDYFRLISTGNYNITKFFNEYIIGRKIEQPKLTKLYNYFHHVAPYLEQIYKAGNLDYSQIVKNAINNQTTDTSSLQLILQVAKNFPLQQEILINDLLTKLKIIGQNQQNKSYRINQQQCQTIINKFNYRDRLTLTSQNKNTIYNRYILQSGKLYRKFTIDLINVYKISDFILTFERSHRRSNMRIILKSCTNNNNWKTQLDVNYPQYVWEQLTICPYTNQFQKNIKDSKKNNKFNSFYLPIQKNIISRYLQLQISFNLHPNIGSVKIIENIPQSEITPQIHGEYYSQSQCVVDIFKNTDINGLTFVKNIGGINKFNVNSLNSTYYYDSDQISPLKNQNKMVNVSKSQQNKILMLACIEIDQLISRGTDKYSQQTITTLLRCVTNFERNLLLQKIILLLRKIAKLNEQAALFIFKNKLPSQFIFNSIFKQSTLNPQRIIKILSHTPTNVQFENAIFYAKAKQQKNKQLFENILQLSIKNKRIDQILVLHQGYGWVDATPKILDIALESGNRQVFNNIIKLCQDNKSLAKYGQSLLERQGLSQQFDFVFEELLQKSRKIKIQQVNSLLTQIINHLKSQTQNQQIYDQAQITQKFTLLTVALNQFHCSHQLINSYITLFSLLPHKQNILNKFLSLKQFKQNQFTDLLINLCINLLSTEINQTFKREQSLSLVYEIMIFIFRNQGNSGNQWMQKVIQNDGIKITELFGTMLVKQLCFCSEANSKIIDSDKRLKLSLGFCLSNIIQKISTIKQKFKQKINIPEKTLRNLFKWLLLNQRISNIENKKANLSHFNKIEQATWLLVLFVSNKSPETAIQIFKQQFQKIELEIKKVKNKVHQTIYQKKILNMAVNYLDKLEQETVSSLLIDELFKKFMTRVINKDINDLDVQEPQKNKIELLTQKQHANNFQLQNQANKPKDWLIYRNGAKNSVFKFDYPKGTQNSYQILLKLNTNDHLNLSKIMMGFQQAQTTHQSYCIPRQILIEAGSKLNELKFIGKLIQIPDNHFINYSVRVFGLNCAQIYANKLSSSLNKYPQAKYIKLTLKSPQIGTVTEALNITDLSKSKNFGTSINFLSIQAYSSALPSNPQLQNIQAFIKSISLFKHKQSLKKLFNKEQNVKIFKDSLINWSTIMKNQKYAEDIYKFIMRVCQVNTQIGNQTIQKYLHLGNSQTCSKIVSEVILSNEQSLHPRILILHKFIVNNLDSLKLLQPFLNKFCQIVYCVQKNKKLKNFKVQLQFNTSQLCEIITSKTITIIFAKYLCTIMKLETPFFGIDLNHTQIIRTLYETPSNLNKQIFEALVISQKNSRSWFMQNNCLQSLFNNIINNMKKKSEDATQLKNDLQTLSSLCFNNNIKSIINKNRYNIDIFNYFVSQQHNKILVGEKNEELRESFVNFINKSVLGSENQRVVAQILKSSLTSSAIDQNKYFVGQIFLPILNSYAKTTLCVHPYDPQENKILIDMNLRSSKGIKKTKATQQTSNSAKFRLPTNLLTNKTKSDLFDKIKQKTKLQAGNFNLVGSHSNDAAFIFDLIEKKITTNNQSLLFLFKTHSSSQKSEVLGIFYREQSSIRTTPLQWNQKCIMFIVKEKQSIKFIDVNKQTGKKFVSIRDDSKQIFSQDQFSIEKSIQINYQNVPFCQIYSNDMFGSSYINLDILRGTYFGDYKLESAQYWTFDPITIPETKQKQQLSLTDEILSLYNISFFESTFQSRSCLRLLRYDKIYEFPSSLTFRQLKLAVQIMKCKLKDDKDGKFKILAIDNMQIGNDITIHSLLKKDEENPILDLLLESNQIANSLDLNTEGNSRTTTYLPKRGIMKYFEQINGVTSMIKVIKKSLQGWKNKQRKEKWYQYVLELQKFSSFPHFFGMYLKDSETFDLLFKLLSGLPDTEQDKKWDQLQSKSTQKLLKIIAEILSMDKTTQFRQYAMKHDFFNTILQRLKILTGQFKREWKQIQQKESQQVSPSKQLQNDDGTKQIKKKKGVGYGNDGSSNTKWMKGTTQAEMMKQFEVTELILNIIQNFLDLKHWNVPKKLLENIYQSALLPYLEDSLRAGTLLQISKLPSKFKLVFKILKTLSKNASLVPILMPIHKNYHPRQIQSLQSLLKSLQNTATIFLSCLKSNKDSTSAQKVSEELSKDIIQTSKIVEQAIEEYVENQHEGEDESQMKNILQLPLDKKYRTLLKDLRFDYIDMKQASKIKHHYSANFNANYVPNQNKMIRLAQQLADISTALPYEHTNAIFVRCDKDRVDFMQALIMGANGTPYGHGAYLFDIYFDDSYPNTPPKVNLTTTGHGKVRFNPNLYACGKVCLSLLGTWRGSASENWDPKVSTLLQVLVSIQAIIMSEQVYFNEPGFEGEQGTTQGQKKNQAYSNIVRYSNIKFAMIENIRNPPKGFENIIKRHFYLKQHQIMDQCKKWLLYAQKRLANYIGLVNDHNSSWSTQFKKSKTQYKQMLQKAIEELEKQFKNLPVPSIHDITSRKAQKKQKKKKQNTDMLKKLQEQNQQQIDVQYDKKDINGKQIDINDEKVKDRWSRYIGAMGIDAVSKQSKADILVFGLGPMALEVIKNLVLSGCRKLTLVDDKSVRIQDLSGGFFYTQADVGKKRTQSILYKIRQLNIYVKIDVLAANDVTQQIIKTYHLVFVTEINLKEQFKLNEQCRVNNIKFISAEFRGAHCRVFNDFGEKFEVLDKNGEQPVEVIIKSITCSQNGVATLLDGAKHPYEDGQVVHIKNVEGMAHKQDKTKSINGTLHKVKVINSKSFQIGDTTMYEPYVRNGLVKNVKTPVFIKFQSMKQVFQRAKDKLTLDENLEFYDFSKMTKNKQMHFCFVALDLYMEENNGKFPSPWNVKDANKLVQIFQKIYGQQVKPQIKAYVQKFAFTCSGFLPPLGAYLGGFISQQIIKAITQKYKPLNSVFYMDAEQIIPEIPDIEKKTDVQNLVLNSKDHRDKGFEIVVGKQLLQLIKNSTSFMIGSGAIGCQLLKNFAMIGLGTGQKGKITLTDPDHIQNSNLNRQFLFRQKHISKPKSRTAAASVLLMNPNLKGHVSALLERVSESTKNIFSNKFFQSLTFVANALDNVAARRYVDQRCVQNKIPLFQSGTLGPKGHTQVIIPYKTESYGSQNDPIQEGQIPHCTLKMFPQQTLHCVEWARDIFGKKFSLQPKAFLKIKDPKYKPEKDDIKSLNECIVMATKGPKNFQDCIAYAVIKFYKYFRDDIMQLLYTYPLDAKTKDGQPFWKLPKRPPTPIMKFDPENKVQCTFIASMAVLVAKIYKIPYPKTFRQQKQRIYIGKQAAKIKIPEFIPSDQKAKSILKQIADQKKQNKAQQQDQKQKQMQENSDKNQNQLYEQFIKYAKQMQIDAEQFEKDNDQNGHIDFIYSMANLRSLNYKLDQMDWITTKLKAGRIVPALATTTTCVAGLQTLQICKYIGKLKLEVMKNSFLNLAVPSLQMSEPGQVKKVKLTDKVQVNLWDRWEVECTQHTTFDYVFDELKKKYDLNPIGVLQGMSRIDTSKTQQGKKQFLKSKLLDRLDKQDDYIDIVVLFTHSKQDQKLIQNVPPVRLRFQSKK